MVAPKKGMTSAQKARDKASGTSVTKVTTTKSIKDQLLYPNKPSTPSSKAKVLAANTRYTLKNKNSRIPVTKVSGQTHMTTKRVPSDAYDTLAKLADAQNLTGQARDRAISSAFKVVSSRMQSDRNRTASRAEASEKRNAKGTKNVSNTRKLISGK
jgi:hypothetical protein